MVPIEDLVIPSERSESTNLRASRARDLYPDESRFLDSAATRLRSE
jgi:hypothetical protein